MMLEETIIRENATSKLQSRVGAADGSGRASTKVVGPPVSFMSPVTPSKTQASTE